MSETRRRRNLYLLWIILVIAAGLASRASWLGLPWFWAKYLGDALWALMVFFGFAFLCPTASTWRVAILTCVFSTGIEISQLYHAPWLDAIRATKLGHLVLGEFFAWGDLPAYLAGAASGAGLEGLGTWLNKRFGLASGLVFIHSARNPS